MPRPENATALVTGASKGIGAAIARALAEDGWLVGVNYRSDEEGAKATVEAIEQAGGRAAAVHGDVANGAPDELLERVEAELGPVLALVNNAGVTADGLAIQMDDEAWDTVLQTNLTAAFRMTRSAMRPMIKARYGRVINVASVVGPRANAGQANYAAAKAGLIGMTKTVSHEVARRGITVNAVAPGFIETAMTAAMPLVTREGGRRMNSLAQGGQPVDVAETVAWLASPASGGVNGNVVRVCGQSLIGA